MKTGLIFTNSVGKVLDDLADSMGNPRTIIIADTNTSRLVLPLLQKESATASAAHVITVREGEDAKTIDSLSGVWTEMDKAGATRSSLVVNLGGGVVTDLGGFAAATYKRGIRFINIPTTVLCAVDASYGGKTGINFNGAKNQIGAFASPEATIISSIYFSTLPDEQILSGYAEMLKHALLDNRTALDRLMAVSPVRPHTGPQEMLTLVEKSLAIKQRVVDADPFEHGLRKILNLGHTAGHAIESLALGRKHPVTHGHAVAWGTVTALILSHLNLGFPSETLHVFASYIRDNFGAWPLTCKDYPTLMALMKKDKKNLAPDSIFFTLLKDVGMPQTDCICPQKQIEAALDIYRDLMQLP